MPAIVLKLAARLFGERFTKIGAWVMIVALLIAAAVVAKNVYDSRLVARHDDKRTAHEAIQARQASETATVKDADRQEEFRNSQDHIKEKVNEARDNGDSPLDAYFDGLRDSGQHTPAR